jgi:hypothetical protein
METILVTGAFLLAAFGRTAQAQEIPPGDLVRPPIMLSVSTSSPEWVKLRIQHFADLYGVSSKTMRDVVNCESGYNPEANGDYSTTTQSYTSHGLVQIHKVPGVHEDITHEQAHDIDFSLDFLAKNLKDGKGSMWTCFK